MADYSGRLEVVASAIAIAMMPTPLKERSDDGSSSRVFQSSCPLPPWQFELTHITRAVHSDRSSGLLNYLYHPKPAWHFESDAVKQVWDRACLECVIPAKKSKTLSILCYLALQNYRSEINHGRPAHKVNRLIEISGVSASNWRRDWLPFWRVFSDVCYQLDLAALTRMRSFINEKD